MTSDNEFLALNKLSKQLAVCVLCYSCLSTRIPIVPETILATVKANPHSSMGVLIRE